MQNTMTTEQQVVGAAALIEYMSETFEEGETIVGSFHSNRSEYDVALPAWERSLEALAWAVIAHNAVDEFELVAVEDLIAAVSDEAPPTPTGWWRVVKQFDSDWDAPERRKVIARAVGIPAALHALRDN